MSNDTPTAADPVYTADPNDPEAIAREAVEAMRARGPAAPEVETAILGAGRQHAELLKRIGWPEGEADG